MPPEALSGDLRWVSLASLLQLAESEAHTGRLVLGGGTVTVKGGRPVAATWRALSGRKALLQALLTPGGRFALQVGESVSEDAPIGDVQALVMDACRLTDELERLRPMRLAATSGAAEADPIAEQLRLAMDGRRDVPQLLAHTQIPEVLAIDPLVSMVARGAARHVEGPPATTPATTTTTTTAAVDQDELVARARAAMRARDLDLALDLFRQALERDPGDRVLAQNVHRVELLRRSS